MTRSPARVKERIIDDTARIDKRVSRKTAWTPVTASTSASDSSSNPEDRFIASVSRVRVRYAETDAMGWVYYACYLQYFEVARSDLIRVLWKSYRRIEDEDGLKLPVVEAGCKYISGARYEDELDICAKLTLDGGIRLHLNTKFAWLKPALLSREVSLSIASLITAANPSAPAESFMQFLKS